jgi:hypothetical protein
MGFNDQFALQKSQFANVRFGSKTDLTLLNRDDRFTAESRHSTAR